MEIVAQELDAGTLIDGHASVFFCISFYGHSQVQLSPTYRAEVGTFEYCAQPLRISSNELQALCTTFTGASTIDLASPSAISLILNSYVNFELFEMVPVNSLNPKDSKSPDLAVTYLETQSVPLGDFVTQGNAIDVCLQFLGAEFKFQLSIAFLNEIELAGATIGSATPFLDNFSADYSVPGHIYVLEVNESDIIYKQEMEIADGQLRPISQCRMPFADYKQLSDAAQSFAELIEQSLTPNLNQSQNASKTPRDKQRSPQPETRVFQEPLEIALLNRLICDNSPYKLVYLRESRERLNSNVSFSINLTPDLRSKMIYEEEYCKKPIEKPAFESPFFANFVFPDVAGVSRRALCSTEEIEARNERLFRLKTTFELCDLDKMSSVSTTRKFMLPWLDMEAEGADSGLADKKPGKQAKYDEYGQFSDGGLNYVYLNEIIGIEKLLEKVAKPLPNCAALGGQNAFIEALMQDYLQDMRSEAKIEAIYTQLFKLLRIQKQLLGESEELEIYPYLQLEFKFPITLRPVRLNMSPGSVEIPITVQMEPEKQKTADIHKTTIYFLNQLQDAYFVTAYNGCVSADEKVGNLAEQKALKKLELNKEYNLRGIQGLEQQKTFIETSKVKDDVDVNFHEFVHMIEADGMIDLLVRDLLPVLRSHISVGFANRTDIVNYLLNLVENQVTDEIFMELQQQKRAKKEQREAAEKIALISMASDSNMSPDGLKRESLDTSGKKKMFKTIKLNNELSNALLKINAQMELEKRIKIEEKLLEVVEKVEYTAEQLDLVERISTSLYFAASNNHNFAQFAYKYALGLLERMLGIHQQPTRAQVERLSEVFPNPSYTQTLIYSLLLSAFQISQPVVINEKEDFDRVISNLKGVTAFAMEVAENEPQLVNIDTAILVSCILVSETDWQVKIDKEEKISEYIEQLRDEYGPDDTSTTREPPPPVAAPKLENLEIVLMLETILKQANHFLINFMVNFSLTSAERYRPTEHKYDILAELQEGKYRTQDIELIFEILGLPDCTPREFDNNTILAVEMANLKDEVGKRILKNDVDEAQTKEISIRVEETPDFIIGAFLYILYKFQILSAKTISACIFEAIDRMIDEFDEKFRKLVEKVEELDLTASSEALPRFVDSPKQENVTGIPGALPEIGSNGHMVSKPPGLQKNGSSFISVTSVKEKSELTQEIFARMKIIRSSIKMTKFQSQEHLSAVEEHILTQKPDFSKIQATLDKFTDADAFMEHLLNASLPREERQSAALNMSAMLSLAEYLAIRSETHISERIIKYVLKRIENDSSSQAQYEMMRAEFVQLRTLFVKCQYDDVIKLADSIKEQEGSIASKARECPALSYFKAAALMRYVETSDLTKIQKSNILQEIFKHAYNAYIQTQKVKDFDEFFKGSTSIGEAAYYDFSLSFNLVELMLCSINVTEVIGNKQLMEEEIAYSELQSASSVKTLPNLQTSTAFLHQNIPLRFGQIGDQSCGNSEALVVFEDLKTSKARPLGVSEFIQKKQQMQMVKETSPERPHFTSHDERKPEETYLDYVRSSATLHTDENFEKDRTKMLFVIAEAIKQLLESNPGFGPSWSLLALLQATLRNNTEARLSSSVATILSPEIVDCWAIWVSCEILNYGSEIDSAKWLITEFQQQIISMGVEQSRVDFLWRFVMRLLDENQ